MTRSPRAGYTLFELIVALIVMAVIGAGLTRVLVNQNRFLDRQNASRSARRVSRAALALFTAEARMAEVSGALVSADSTSLVLRVPYAFGLVCQNGTSGSTLSLLPVDSLLYAEPGFSGYAWRDSLGAYTYVESGVSLGSGLSAACTGASITTLTGGRVVSVSPALPTAAAVGSPVFLFRRVRYQFAASQSVSGRAGLWRTPVATGVAEEIVSPFDSTSRFRFYVLDADTPQSAAPVPLANGRGVELVLRGLSERAPQGSSSPRQADLVTAIFFKNRLQ